MVPPGAPMSRRVGGGVIIQLESPRKCSYCGEVAECRPYGKGGADICHPCARSTPERWAEAERQMRVRLFGDPEPS